MWFLWALWVFASKSPLSTKEELLLPTRKEKGHPRAGNGREIITVDHSERYWVRISTPHPTFAFIGVCTFACLTRLFYSSGGGEHKLWKWIRQIILLYSNVRGFCSVEVEMFVKQISWGISSYWHSQKSVCVYFFEKTNKQTKTATKKSSVVEYHFNVFHLSVQSRTLSYYPFIDPAINQHTTACLSF